MDRCEDCRVKLDWYIGKKGRPAKHCADCRKRRQDAWKKRNSSKEE